jgi:hypothetical protein
VESKHHELKEKGGNLRNSNIPTLVRRSLAGMDDEITKHMQMAEREKTLQPKRFLFVCVYFYFSALFFFFYYYYYYHFFFFFLFFFFFFSFFFFFFLFFFFFFFFFFSFLFFFSLFLFFFFFFSVLHFIFFLLAFSGAVLLMLQACRNCRLTLCILCTHRSSTKSPCSPWTNTGNA